MNIDEIEMIKNKISHMHEKLPNGYVKTFDFWVNGIKHKLTIRKHSYSDSFIYIDNCCYNGIGDLIFRERCASVCGCWVNVSQNAEDRKFPSSFHESDHLLFEDENKIDFQDIITEINLIMVEVL